MALRDNSPYPEYIQQAAEEIGALSKVPLPGNPYSLCFDDEVERIAVHEGRHDGPSMDLLDWLGGLAVVCGIETNEDEILQLSWAVEDEYCTVVGLRNA